MASKSSAEAGLITLSDAASIAAGYDVAYIIALTFQKIYIVYYVYTAHNVNFLKGQGYDVRDVITLTFQKIYIVKNHEYVTKPRIFNKTTNLYLYYIIITYTS